MRRTKGLAARFEAKVGPLTDSGCREWQASLNGCGYGRIVLSNRPRRIGIASRVAWELYVGAIPVGLQVLHRCDNPPCVNVDHLFLGTQADNVRDMIEKGRKRGRQPPSHCPTGHPYSEENTITYKGSRHCRECQRIRSRVKVRVPTELRSRNGRWSMHVRWHMLREQIKQGCEFCPPLSE